MKNARLRSVVAIVSLAASSMSLSLLPSAAHAANAEQFMNGGEYCFLLGEVIPGGLVEKIKMVVSHEAGGIAHINAVLHGSQATNPPISYTSPMTGSAVIANDSTDPKDLRISLQGSNFGTDETPGITGIWIADHAILLKRLNLTGHDTGLSVFTPIQAGQAGASHTHPTDAPVTPIACRDF